AVGLPMSFTAAQITGGFVTFVPSLNLNGAGAGSITFAVTDDDGATDGTPNTLTVDVSAVNDSPVLSTTSPVAATEQTAVAILNGATVSDADLDARNGGNGDYAGAVFSVNRNPAANVEDVFTIVAGPNFTIDGINLKTLGGQIFGHINANSNGLISITFTSLETIATSALVDEVIQSLRYTNSSDSPPASVTLAVGFTDGSPGGGQGAGASGLDVDLVTVNITAVNELPVVTVADATVSGTEDEDVVFSVAGGNGITLSDLDHSTLNVVIFVNSGTLTLATTTNLSVTGNGTGTINISGTIADINAALDGLVYRGNLNFNGGDTLTIQAFDPSAGFDSETIAITLAPDGTIDGTSGDDDLTGTSAGDLFLLQQGGDDTATGLEGADGFYFGAEYTMDDTVHGNGGRDQLGLQGDYSGGLTLGTITGLEDLILLSGSITRFGDTANNFYDYDITTQDSNVAAGATLLVDGVTLRAGEDLTFDGSAETDGNFLIYAGMGVDNLTGGMGNDGFLFRGGGHLTGADVVHGGLGSDHLGLRGDYTGGNAVVLTATSMTGIEVIVVLSGEDVRFGPAIGPCSYDITMHDANVLAGQRMIIDAATLRPTESLTFDGSAESDGSFRIVGGGCDDFLIGSQNDDLITGALGADILAGGGGNDRFIYRSVLESEPGLPDFIVDFSDGDIIDLALVDADSTTDGNQAFTFIDDNAFTGQAGQLRSEDLGGGNWVVQADIDGDGFSDFDLLVFSSDADPIASNDFIL
ncbi:MAG TPA: hypothetical protein VGC46_01605, partial [Allosphingosinicella sp.]